MSNHNSQLSEKESALSPFINGSRFRRNLFVVSLFSLPVIYLGIILAVTLHEVIGHGLAAFLLGGRFNGFGIHLDGMGWASVEFADLPALSKALVFLGGPFCTMVFSLLFFKLSVIFKKKYFTSLTFMFLAITSLLDGLPYFFWDAVFLGGIGDFSGIWALYPEPVLRAVVIVLSGLLMAIAIILFNLQYYKMICSWVGEGKSIKLKGKITVSISIFLLEFMGWSAFDWNQLIPGIGSLPNIVALAISFISLAILIVLYEVKGFEEPRKETSHVKTPMFAAWLVCVGVVFVIMQWLQQGVFF